MPGIVWADMEAATVRYLQAWLDARPEPVTADVRVSAAKDSSPRQVIVRDDGGDWVGDVRAIVRLGVNIWCPTWDETYQLGALVTAALNAWPDGQPVVRASASRAFAVADEASPLRYLTAELTIRGTAI